MKKTALKRNQKPLRKRALGRPPIDKSIYLTQTDVFNRIWNALKSYQRVCYETGERLYANPSDGLPYTVYFHHVLAKEIYPQFALSPWNIVLVSLSTHTQYETAPRLCPKIYTLYLEFKAKLPNLEA